MRVAAAGNACLSIQNGAGEEKFRPPDAVITTACVFASLSMRKHETRFRLMLGLRKVNLGDVVGNDKTQTSLCVSVVSRFMCRDEDAPAAFVDGPESFSRKGDTRWFTLADMCNATWHTARYR